MKRFLFDALLFISLFIFPWWFNAVFVLIGIFIFDNFYEFIISGVIFFSLYALPEARGLSSPIIFSLGIIFVYIVIQYIKSNIIFYKK